MRARRAVAFLAVLVLTTAAPQAYPDGSTVSGKELARLGFFQDFDELDLATLLETATPTVSVATRLEGTVAHTPATVEVITDEQMRSRGARTLEDVLLLVPGFDVVRDTLGRPRVVVRGSGLDGAFGATGGVLVLLNGQHVNEALTGTSTNVNLDLPIEHVHRVEIWRGAGSALYGAGAARAVINVVTHTVREFQGIGLSAELGSFTSQNYALRLANTFKGVSFSCLLQWTDSDGAKLLVPVDRQTARDAQLAPLGIGPASLAPGNTKDDRRVFQTTYVIGYGDFTLQWHSQSERTGAYVGYADTLGTGNLLDSRQNGVGLAYNHTFAAGHVQARFDATTHHNDQTLNTAPPNFTLALGNEEFATFPAGTYLQSLLAVKRYSGELLAERKAGQHTFLAGGELAHESTFDLDVRSNLDYIRGGVLTDVQSLPGAVAPQERDLAGIYVQDSWSKQKVGLTAGMRFDHVSDAGDHLSPRVALSVDARDDLNIRASYARGFRAPSFEELYFNFPGQRGNPALEAPTSDTFEGGLTFRVHGLTLGAQGFWIGERDPIVLPAPFDPAVTQSFVNGPDLLTRGIELQVQRSFGLESNIFANAVFQRAEYDAASGRVRAAGIPSQLVNAGLTFNLGPRLLVTPTVAWRGSRPRATGDLRAPVESYALANVALRWRKVYKTLELAGVVNNIFDKRYADPAPVGGLPQDYPRAGVSVRVQASYRF